MDVLGLYWLNLAALDRAPRLDLGQTGGLIPKVLTGAPGTAGEAGSKAPALARCLCHTGRCPSGDATGVTSPESGQMGTARLGGHGHFLHLEGQVDPTSVMLPLGGDGPYVLGWKMCRHPLSGYRASCDTWGPNGAPGQAGSCMREKAAAPPCLTSSGSVLTEYGAPSALPGKRQVLP